MPRLQNYWAADKQKSPVNYYDHRDSNLKIENAFRQLVISDDIYKQGTQSWLIEGTNPANLNIHDLRNET